MKKFYILGILGLLSCAMLSCTKENVAKTENDEGIQEETITRTITVSQDIPESRTTIDGSGNISWESGDKIYYYDYYYDGETLKQSDKKNIVLSTAGQSAALNLSIRANATGLGLLMPGKDGRTSNAIKEYNPTAFVYTGINADQDGSFAFANIAVTHSNDAQGVSSLVFKNITAILKFNVSASQNVKKVTLEPNTKTDGHQVSGRITVDLTAENPGATYYSNYPNQTAARSYEAVIDKGDEVMDGTYYFAVMPCTLEDGFSLTFNDGEAQPITGMTYTKQKYTAGTTGSVEFQANQIKNVGNPLENKKVTSFTINNAAEVNSWANSETHTSFSIDNFITVNAPTVEGSNANGLYVEGEASEWRMYQARNNGTFTVSCPSGRKISSITIKFNQSNGGAISYNGTTYVSPATITPASATNSMQFTVVSTTGKTNGQARIKEITVETK